MGTAGQSITLANSIIGVGILAMPFCFQQCGVLLATVILLFMGLISRLCCYFLLKAALLARRRNFEFLAFHVFGPAGKLAVEIGIIGFLMGTCIAYFVVVGDLGPQIIAKLLNINQSDILRTSIMVLVSLVCVLPLGLLRNVDSLSNVSAATIGFYFCLVIKLISEAAAQLISGEWQTKMELWKPSGVLQCVPIFSMALFCQTQLFEIFESLPTLSLEKMNVVTKNAINICTAVYFTLGLFGYIAFCSHTISGNILMSLAPTMANDVIRLGFVMSVAFSFPLIIFPCRASLYSLLYKKAHVTHHDHMIQHSIPESSFRGITVGIIAVALFVSLLIPNIELVLGLVGSTIGVLVCVIFPAAAFVKVTLKNTNERILAKGVLILGLVILVLGTYANLHAAESAIDRYDDNITPEKIDKIVEDFFHDRGDKPDPEPVKSKPVIHEEIAKIEPEKDSVIQPPNPVPPASNEKPVDDKANKEDKNIIPPPADKIIPVPDNIPNKIPEIHPKDLQTKINEIKASNGEKVDNPKEAKKAKAKPPTMQEKTQEKIDIIKQQQLVETIKQHGEEQKELIKEQKQILDEIRKTKVELEQSKDDKKSAEAKKIAVESIQQIANIAIKSLSGVTDKPETLKNIKVKPVGLDTIANEVVQEIAKKAVEAIAEIAEDKPSKNDKKLGINVQANANSNNAPIPNNQNAVPAQNNIQSNPNVQPNVVNYVPPPSVSNFAPINPPVANQNINVPAPQVPHAEALVQNQNIPAQQNTNNNVPVNANNVPIVNPQPIVNQIINNAQANANNILNQPINNQNAPAQNVQQNAQVNPQLNQNYQQPNQVYNEPSQLGQNNQNVQQQNPVQQQNVIQQKREVQQTVEKVVENSQQVQNQNVEVKKAHSHSPDELQSYKQGEDTQNQVDKARKEAPNVPIPIAMNGNANLAQAVNGNTYDAVAQPSEIREVIQNVDKQAQVDQNIGAKNIPSDLNSNGVLRQKREAIDCTETISLPPQDKEILQIGGKEFENERRFRCREFRLFPIPVLLKYPEYLIPVILKLTKKRRHRSLAAMIGREDREDALLKSALQADERVRVVSEHLTECLMLLEEAPNPEDKELVEGDVSQCLELAQDIAQAAADISRRRDGKEKPFRGKVGQGLQVPLPPVTVPVFAGDYADWPAFEDLYSSVVHTRTDITPAYKMAQLMSRLHGEPHELLTHLAVSDSNYEVAWKILTDRYRNKRLIVDRLASPPAERNGRSIRAATWGKSSDHLPTYEDLKSFLEAESRRVDVQAGEAPRKETSAPRHPERPGAPARGGNSGQPRRYNTALESGCAYCRETGHGVAACQEFAAQRVQRRRGCTPSAALHESLRRRRGSAGSDQRRSLPTKGGSNAPPSKEEPTSASVTGTGRGTSTDGAHLPKDVGTIPTTAAGAGLGKSGTGTWPGTPIPGPGVNGRVAGGTRQPPGYMQYSAGLSHLVGSQDPRMPPPMPEYPRLQAQPRYGRLPSGYYRTPAMAFMGRPPDQQEWDPYTGLGSEDTPRDAASPRLDSR
ncbi:transmembrane amino acid transporter protein domain-containing protein [Phthorimaea operculella]|nr:transmembrane amino acid transporter protein domain-containing protein [Phthorimaea operculella]